MDTVQRKSSHGMGGSTIPESDLNHFLLDSLAQILRDRTMIVPVLNDYTNLIEISPQFKKCSNQKIFKRRFSFLLLKFLTEKSTVAATLWLSIYV